MCTATAAPCVLGIKFKIISGHTYVLGDNFLKVVCLLVGVSCLSLYQLREAVGRQFYMYIHEVPVVSHRVRIKMSAYSYIPLQRDMEPSYVFLVSMHVHVF